MGSVSLQERLPAENVNSLWTVMHAMVRPAPSPKAEVTLWSYEKLRPLLLEAGETISAEEAERRVLMLTNPALGPPYTTDTTYAGLQLILPGETAPAHRHRSFALRFIIEGSRGFTAVEGQKVSMEEGDVILTPPWQWHDHGHEGDGPMIWLDGLDLPLFHKIPTHFAQPYESDRYPSKPVADSPLRFPWSDMKAQLDEQSGDWASQHYLFSNGDYISHTLGAHAERIKAGKRSPQRQDTCAYIYHCHVGFGKTEIETPDGENQTVRWKKNDTFALPAWSRLVHEADVRSDAYLFVINDRPLQERLGMFFVNEPKN